MIFSTGIGKIRRVPIDKFAQIKYNIENGLGEIMPYGKAIELYLENGTAEGVITAKLFNWSGKAVKISRLDVRDCAREDIRGAGVYFLLCEDGTESVYIGEAENVYERLMRHLRDFKSGKETYYWHTVVAFVGRDLNKAHIHYLEKRFVAIARACNRYKILTKKTFQNTVMNEAQVASMEEFLENAKVVLGALGCKVLEKTPQVLENTMRLYCKRRHSDSVGFVSQGGYTVVEGSKTSADTTPSLEIRTPAYYALRKRLESDGTIVNGIFQKNYEFTAPSAASSVVIGTPSNGNKDWKNENGKTLKELTIED